MILPTIGSVWTTGTGERVLTVGFIRGASGRPFIIVEPLGTGSYLACPEDAFPGVRRIRVGERCPACGSARMHAELRDPPASDLALPRPEQYGGWIVCEDCDHLYRQPPER